MRNGKLFIAVVFCAFLTQIRAQGVTGADISYMYAGGTIACSLAVVSDIPIDTVYLNSGSGSFDTIPFSQSQQGGEYNGFIIINYTFPGPGTYTLEAKIPYWVPSISNMTASGTQTVNLSGEVVVSPLLDPNHSSQWGYFPNNVQQGGGTYIHDPGYTSVDNFDSIVYSVLPVDASGYLFPSQMGGSESASNGVISVTPVINGLYAVGIRVTEYKEVAPGQFLYTGYTERVIVIDATSMGVSELNTMHWTIYPNPSNGSIRLPENATFDILVFDILGKQVMQQQKAAQQLNVSKLPAGNYTVCILNNADGNWKTGKFVKE
jgi:hypothetical protein